MALQLVTGIASGVGPVIDLGTSDDVVVRNGAFVGATSGTAISGTGSGHQATIAGDVHGGGFGVVLGDSESTDFSQRVTVTATGNVTSDFLGVVCRGGGSSVYNYGLISGSSYGVDMATSTGSMSSIFNYGNIAGDTAAILRNSPADTGPLTVYNFGTVTSSDRAFNSWGATAVDKIYNSGLMIGTVELDGGDDLYDGRGGRVTGTVFGGDGNDTFVAGAFEETFDGGAGIDTIDMRMTQGERVVLNVVAGTGVSQGDLYVNCENTYGSLVGRDLLTGNGFANVFIANGGDDVMNLGAGNDKVIGGEGKDVIWGGTGNDAFIFILPTEGGDFIQDFSNSAGNDDFFQIKASGFGAGLVAGLLPAFQFQTRTDNVAQDADDRFIFRTTDNTLWFDANGSAAGGLTMLADLQAGATVTAADILIY